MRWLGKTKQSAGKALGDREMQAEGKMQHAKGEAQHAAGKVKDAVKKAVDGD